MKALAWLLLTLMATVATWGGMNRISEWERVARYEAAMPHVYKVHCMWSSGSAWVWDEDTFITNMHVVDGMIGFEENVTVTRGRQTWQAVKITRLTGVDAAMVDVKGVPLHALPRDPWPQLRPGMYVMVGGYPMGVGPVMTEGHISGLFQGMYWSDTPVNPGNSGGPVFNKDGEIVGMTVAVTTQFGHSMAILIPLQRIINGMERPEFCTTGPPVDGER